MILSQFFPGFLSTGTKEMPGNNGLFDMVLAVDWVKDYIHFFGGNPNQIVAFGHGTGASSAMMLSLSKFCQSNRNQYNSSHYEYTCLRSRAYRL